MKYKALFVPDDDLEPGAVHEVEAINIESARNKYKKLAERWKGKFIKITEKDKFVVE